MRYENTDVLAHVWQTLVNADTGATLELAPGESAEVLCWVETDQGAHLEPPAADAVFPYLRRAEANLRKPRKNEADDSAITEE